MASPETVNGKRTRNPLLYHRQHGADILATDDEPTRVDRRQGKENQSAPDQARPTSEVKRVPRPRYSSTANGRREVAINDGCTLAAAAGKAARTYQHRVKL